MVHRGDTLTPMIEPIAGVYAAPSGGNQRKIPDEDSLSFQYDDTDLFRPDRLAGYDILDTGQRVDYGLKLGLYDNTGGSYRALVGQSYRAQTNPFLPLGSGAEKRLSDVVGPRRAVAQLLSRPDLSLPPRRQQSQLSQPTGGRQPPGRRICGSAPIIFCCRRNSRAILPATRRAARMCCTANRNSFPSWSRPS